MKTFQIFRFTLPLLVVALAVFSCGGAGGQTANGDCSKPEKVDVKTFSTEIAAGDILLLDVRSPEEYAEGHLEGSVNINYYDDDFKDKLAQLNTEKPVYVYCRSGNRSGKCAVILNELCFKQIKDLDGGITAWQEAGKPVVQ